MRITKAALKRIIKEEIEMAKSGINEAVPPRPPSPKRKAMSDAAQSLQSELRDMGIRVEDIISKMDQEDLRDYFDAFLQQGAELEKEEGAPQVIVPHPQSKDWGLGWRGVAREMSDEEVDLVRRHNKKIANYAKGGGERTIPSSGRGIMKKAPARGSGASLAQSAAALGITGVD